MNSQVNFKSYYSARFARKAKDRPLNWIIVPDGRGWHKLEQIGGFDHGTESKRV